MKTLVEMLAPDARYRVMMINDPILGLRPITAEDHHAMVWNLRLPKGVPETVDRLYERGLHALLYGWFDYELMVVACGQALATLEFALKARLGEPVAKMAGLRPRLAYAVQKGVLDAPPLSAWGDDHDMLARIRNEIAHGSDHVYPPNIAELIFGQCRAVICRLYGL